MIDLIAVKKKSQLKSIQNIFNEIDSFKINFKLILNLHQFLFYFKFCSFL